MTPWPHSLQPIAKYMQRAREVEQIDPVVSYYCCRYSLKRSMEIKDPNDESASRFVTGLLEKCEIQKHVIGPDDGTHRQRLEQFALNVFDKADTEDRNGVASKQTAEVFFAAMCYLEVCTVLGPLSEELHNRMGYAKWKAGDILKALRQGQTPVPGPPGGLEKEKIRMEQERQQQQQMLQMQQMQQQHQPQPHNIIGENDIKDEEVGEEELENLKKMHMNNNANDIANSIVPFDQAQLSGRSSHEYPYQGGAPHEGTHQNPYPPPAGARPSMGIPDDHEYENEAGAYAPEKHHHMFIQDASEHHHPPQPQYPYQPQPQPQPHHAHNGEYSQSDNTQGYGYNYVSGHGPGPDPGQNSNPYESNDIDPFEDSSDYHKPPHSSALHKPSAPQPDNSIGGLSDKFQKAVVVYGDEKEGIAHSQGPGGPGRQNMGSHNPNQEYYYKNQMMLPSGNGKKSSTVSPSSSYVNPQYQPKQAPSHPHHPGHYQISGSSTPGSRHSPENSIVRPIQPQIYPSPSPSDSPTGQPPLQQQPYEQPQQKQYDLPHKQYDQPALNQYDQTPPKNQYEQQSSKQYEHPPPPTQYEHPPLPKQYEHPPPQNQYEQPQQKAPTLMPAPQPAARKLRTTPPSVKEIKDAQKFTKNALSALDFRDFATARSNLLKALSIVEE